jgi:hypothetical protein
MSNVLARLAVLALILGVFGSNCIAADTLKSQDAGTLYESPDKIASYLIMKKVAKYSYHYPTSVVPGQKFAIDEADLLPDALTADCSDTEYRCVSFDKLAIAVPKRRLASDDSYAVRGSSVKVVECLRGFGKICQVALMESQCYVTPSNVCEPTRDKKFKNELWSALFFIYNEDFGVTSFGLSPATPPHTSVEIQNDAKDYILVGGAGLLKP